MSKMGVAPAPCARCPFRKDVPIYLRLDRRQGIIHSIVVEGKDFYCHETTVAVEDEDGEEDMTVGAGSLICAGAVKMVEHNGGSTQMMRIAERLGYYDREKNLSRGAEVWTVKEFQFLPEGAVGDQEESLEEYVETCVQCDPGCLAPAGYMGAGGVVEGTEAADGTCEGCGEGLCSNCADENGMCGMCAHEHSDG